MISREEPHSWVAEGELPFVPDKRPASEGSAKVWEDGVCWSLGAGALAAGEVAWSSPMKAASPACLLVLLGLCESVLRVGESLHIHRGFCVISQKLPLTLL